MSVCRFDTFENEVEMAQLIEKLQSRSIEFMKIKDSLDEVMVTPLKS